MDPTRPPNVPDTLNRLRSLRNVFDHSVPFPICTMMDSDIHRMLGEAIQLIEASPHHAQQRTDQPGITVYFDGASGLSAEDIETFLAYIAETYRSLGGIGLRIVGTASHAIPAPLEPEAG